MPDSTLDSLRYPIGKFLPKEQYSREEINGFINSIKALPDAVERLTASLSEKQLATPYRPDGWTGLQVIHHLADSHLNAYIRTKWTLTESAPTIKAYDEKRWAETPETKLEPVLSIALLKALHAKWSEMLSLLSAEEMKRSFIHPENGRVISVERMTALYAWHGEHHLGHLRIVSSK